MTVFVTRSIRKALEAPLEAALVAGGVCIDPQNSNHATIWWPNLPIDPDDYLHNAASPTRLEEYVRMTVHGRGTFIRTLGSTPRIEQRGIARFLVNTRASTGQDRNDTIAGIVAGAYPYNATLTRDGISVFIDRNEPGDGVPVGDWFGAMVDVYWSVWRT
jgi:hypothetical protein